MVPHTPVHERPDIMGSFYLSKNTKFAVCPLPEHLRTTTGVYKNSVLRLPNSRGDHPKTGEARFIVPMKHAERRNPPEGESTHVYPVLHQAPDGNISETEWELRRSSLAEGAHFELHGKPKKAA